MSGSYFVKHLAASSQAWRAVAVGLPTAGLGAYLASRAPLAALFLGAALILAFRNPLAVTALTAVFVVISPKIHGNALEAASFFLRFDDLLLWALLASTVVRLRPADLPFLTTPLDKAVSGVVLAFAASVIHGLVAGTIGDPLMAAATLGKFLEYFVLFWATGFHIRDRRGAHLVLAAYAAGILTLCLYGVFERAHPLATLAYPSYYRVFERGFFYGQANHFGGTLALFLTLALGIAVLGDRPRVRVPAAAAAPLAFVVMLWTHSRQAWIAFAAASVLLGALLLRVAPRRALLFAIASLALLAAALDSPSVRRRIASVPEAIATANPNASSVGFRMRVWSQALEDTARHPVLGTGIGSRQRAFYESQWVMFLAEAGIAGLVSYLWLVWRSARSLWAVLRRSPDPFSRSLAAGAIAGLGCLIVQGLACNVFAVTVTAAPWYVVLAVVLAMNRGVLATGGRENVQL